jgi:hypothetical protein
VSSGASSALMRTLPVMPSDLSGMTPVVLMRAARVEEHPRFAEAVVAVEDRELPSRSDLGQSHSTGFVATVWKLRVGRDG